MTLLASRTLWEIVGVVLLIGGFTLYERHAGAAKCVAADNAAVASQEVHNAAVQATDTATITQEATAHAAAISQPTIVIPALRCVRVGAARGAVPQAATAGPASDGGANVPAAVGPGAQPNFDPGPAVTAIGRDADAQVSELQSYIKNVCLAP